MQQWQERRSEKSSIYLSPTSSGTCGVVNEITHASPALSPQRVRGSPKNAARGSVQQVVVHAARGAEGWLNVCTGACVLEMALLILTGSKTVFHPSLAGQCHMYLFCCKD
jgi:hypothetical protein